MLVLSRNENERIRIGDEIWLMVVKIDGNRVLLGFQADPSVLILREELLPKTAATRIPSPISEIVSVPRDLDF